MTNFVAKPQTPKGVQLGSHSNVGSDNYEVVQVFIGCYTEASVNLVVNLEQSKCESDCGRMKCDLYIPPVNGFNSTSYGLTHPNFQITQFT